MGQYYAAVDIGATKTTASVSSRDGILARVYQLTKKRGNEATVPRQVDFLIACACQQAGIVKGQIAAVGISTVGPFEKRDGRLALAAPNVCGALGGECEGRENDWTLVPLEEELSGKYRRLRIANDCISAAVAERSFGAGRGQDDLLYVTWSTGIGGGAFVDGHLLTGKNDNALHLGHIVMSYRYADEPRCGCGGRAHLEALVAGPAIAREYGEQPPEVFRRCRNGDKRAEALIQRVARVMAIGLYSAIALLDSRLIIVGGSVSKNWDLLEPLVVTEFYKQFPALTREVVLTRSQLDQYLGDMAGLSLVMPDSWIADWQETRPWENAPETTVLDPEVV
ncbi:MAG: ROK family protein [Spirochaetaceae bacterium]|nr:MAG: ROK family protein [Spirochaetaceae bacterium]